MVPKTWLLRERKSIEKCTKMCDFQYVAAEAQHFLKGTGTKNWGLRVDPFENSSVLAHLLLDNVTIFLYFSFLFLIFSLLGILRGHVPSLLPPVMFTC